MIQALSLLRVDCAFKFTNSCKKLKLFQQLQVCYFRSSLNFKSIADKTRSKQGLIEQKSKMWRPITTQTTCAQDSSKTLQVELEEEGTSCITAPSEKKHSISLEVGASLMRFIKGRWGATQKTIEEEIGVKLIFPSSRNEDTIVIEGTSADNITRASERIQSIVNEAVKSTNLDYSHFVSLPLALHPELVEKLVNFQTSILETNNLAKDENNDSDEDILDNKDEGNVAVNLEVENDREHVKVDIKKIQRVSYAPKVPNPSEQKPSQHSSLFETGIERSIFIKPATFHLTVLMLKLWNKERVASAAESVASKVQEALDSRPVSIQLKGLQCMRGSLAKARVVYAPVEEIGCEGRLERACQVIIDAYVEAGLVLEKDAQTKLKLHATLMNARHRKRKKKTRFADSFDAGGIFKKYGSEQWGEYLVPEAHLSQRFVFDENGYYHRCSSFLFPKVTNDSTA